MLVWCSLFKVNFKSQGTRKLKESFGYLAPKCFEFLEELLTYDPKKVICCVRAECLFLLVMYGFIVTLSLSHTFLHVSLTYTFTPVRARCSESLHAMLSEAHTGMRRRVRLTSTCSPLSLPNQRVTQGHAEGSRMHHARGRNAIRLGVCGVVEGDICVVVCCWGRVCGCCSVCGCVCRRMRKIICECECVHMYASFCAYIIVYVDGCVCGCVDCVCVSMNTPIWSQRRVCTHIRLFQHMYVCTQVLPVSSHNLPAPCLRVGVGDMCTFV